MRTFLPTIRKIDRSWLGLAAVLYIVTIAIIWSLWVFSTENRLQWLERSAISAQADGDTQASQQFVSQLAALSPAHAAFVRARLTQSKSAASQQAPDAFANHLRQASADTRLTGRVRALQESRLLAAPPAICPILTDNGAQSATGERPTYRGDGPKLDGSLKATIVNDIGRFRKNALSDEGAALGLLSLYENGDVRPHSQRAVADLRDLIFQMQLQRARNGQPSAMLRVASSLGNQNGLFGANLARTWVERAAEAGNQTGRACYVQMLRAETASPENLARTHKMLVDLAASGSDWAKVELGFDAMLGRGTPVDLVGARRIFSTMEGRSVTARSRLAGMMIEGKGGPADVARGLALMASAAAGGSADANLQLAQAYEKGRFGLVVNDALSLEYLRRAGEGGNRNAMVALARRYAAAPASEDNDRAATRWAMAAVQRGANFADLQLIKATALLIGQEVPQDKPQGEAMLKALAEKGNASAMLQLGRLYLTYQTPAARRTAIGLLQRSAQLGQSTALVDLGRSHASGLGVEIDAQRSAFYFRSAALAGNPEGMIEYAKSLAAGFGTPRDPAASAQWFLRAAEAGDPQGMINYAYALARGEGVASSLPEARQWIEKGVAANDPESKYWMAVYLLEGLGGPADRGRALQLLEAAGSEGFSPARVLTARLGRGQS